MSTKIAQNQINGMLSTTLAEATANNAAYVGMEVTISNRGYGVFKAIDGTGTANGLDKVAHDTLNLTFVLRDYDGDIVKLGAVSGVIHNAIIAQSIVLVNKAFLAKDSFNLLLSAPIDVGLNTEIDFNLNDITKDVSWVPNSAGSAYATAQGGSYFNHIANGGILKNLYSSNIGSTERLISYSAGADNCIEIGCGTGRGSSYLFLFQGVVNNNYSQTLDIKSKGRLDPSKPLKKFAFHLTTPDATSTSQVRRARFFPSIASISHIKVSDTSGSPDFYFEIRMNNGGITYPYIRARSTTDIDEPVTLDWFQDSFDDILMINIQNFSGLVATFDIEIYYRDGRNGLDETAWVYQSVNDFNRPHQNGAATIQQAQRGIEYRSYIDGSGLDVSTATVDRVIDTNYNYPTVTVPTPAGVRDTAQTTELKFYLNFSAEQALASGATHLRFRVYQQTRQIKCTCINGFLTQVPDWSPAPTHLATSFQPDIEVDFIGATQDIPQEVLIPLDIKGMMNAAAEATVGDLHYFYLTFYQHLVGHVPIEWGDVWQFDAQFIKA